MTRVIRPQSASSMRSKLLKLLAHAVHSDQQGGFDPSERRDVLAFAVHILGEIAESVSATVNAWEKRGYWVKADRFSQEWSWVVSVRRQLAIALADPEIPSSALLYQDLVRHLSDIQVPTRIQRSKPWTGAWQEAGSLHDTSTS